MSNDILNFVQILVSILVVVTILVQVRGQGTGLFGSAEASVPNPTRTGAHPVSIHRIPDSCIHNHLHHQRSIGRCHRSRTHAYSSH